MPVPHAQNTLYAKLEAAQAQLLQTHDVNSSRPLVAATQEIASAILSLQSLEQQLHGDSKGGPVAV